MPTLVDENIPQDVFDWLAKKGFQPTNVSQTYLRSAKDYAVAEYAAKNDMTLITIDQGFARIYPIFKKEGISIIIIKAHPTNAENILQVLAIAQSKMDLRKIRNKLVILSKRNIRVIV